MHLTPLVGGGSFKDVLRPEDFSGMKLKFEPDVFFAHVKRGMNTTENLNEGWDYWAVMRESVEDLRRAYNIEPRARL